MLLNAANNIPVELITESGDGYAFSTPVEQEDQVSTFLKADAFDVELTQVAPPSFLSGAGKNDANYGSLQGLLHDSQSTDAMGHRRDKQVSALSIFPAALRCGISERTSALIVCAVSVIIAVATLAMQSLNPTSTVGG